MSILLVRHGETTANAARVVQMPDAPLSERGLAQAGAPGRAARAARRDGDRRQRLRARHVTAERVRVATGAPLELWPDLRERNFGELRGRSYAEIGVDIFAPDFAPPGGETWPRVPRAASRARGSRSARARARLRRQSGRDQPRTVLPFGGRAPRPARDGRGGSRRSGRTPRSRCSPRRRPHEIALLNCSAHLAALEAPIGTVSGPV